MHSLMLGGMSSEMSSSKTDYIGLTFGFGCKEEKRNCSYLGHLRTPSGHRSRFCSTFEASGQV